MAEALIIEITGWTHDEYQAQPTQLIQAIRIKQNTFARIANEEAKKKH